MEVKEMQKIVDNWIKENSPGYWEPNNMMLRVMEEVGELSREINDRYGEKPKKKGSEKKEIGYEIADIIFALVCISNSLGIDLEESFKGVISKYDDRDKERYSDE